LKDITFEESRDELILTPSIECPFYCFYR
jgi:hypothetical protein